MKIECSIDKGNNKGTSTTFIEDKSLEYMVFDIDCSFKVDLKNI